MHFESNESNKILKFITFTILQKKKHNRHKNIKYEIN